MVADTCNLNCSSGRDLDGSLRPAWAKNSQEPHVNCGGTYLSYQLHTKQK
jgi:hypothetical protein